MRTCSHDKYEIYVLLKLGIRFVKPGRMAVYEVQCTVTSYDDVYIDAIEKLRVCMHVYFQFETPICQDVWGKKSNIKNTTKKNNQQAL